MVERMVYVKRLVHAVYLKECCGFISELRESGHKYLKLCCIYGNGIYYE